MTSTISLRVKRATVDMVKRLSEMAGRMDEYRKRELSKKYGKMLILYEK